MIAGLGHITKSTKEDIDRVTLTLIPGSINGAECKSFAERVGWLERACFAGNRASSPPARCLRAVRSGGDNREGDHRHPYRRSGPPVYLRHQERRCRSSTSGGRRHASA